MHILVRSRIDRLQVPPLTIYGVQAFGGMLARTRLALEVNKVITLESAVVDGQFNAELQFGDHRLPFAFNGVDDRDRLDIVVRSPKSLWLKLRHLNLAKPPCSAVCWNGDSGQPCVDCRKGGISYRICC